MNEFFSNAVYLGALLTIGMYWIGTLLKKKLKLAIFNPFLLAVILVIVFLLVFHIDYQVYYAGAKYISYFLTPATICLAIPLYEQFEYLKKDCTAIIVGVVAGMFSSLLSILGLSILFGLDHQTYITIMPRAITAPIAIGISEEYGGIPSLTILSVMIAGILGNMIAEPVCRLCKITEPVAKGVGIGSASHIIGTTKAMEMGPVEGAISSLSLIISGVLTVFSAMLFAMLW